MRNEAYITRISKFLPNEPRSNDETQEYLGMINGKPSLARGIVLRKNKISSRYYALDEQGRTTHTNADLTAEAIKGLTDESFLLDDLEFLACGTTTPDQLLPSHASMVHGLLKCRNIELASFAGACCSGVQALKSGYMSVVSGNTKNAIATGSERVSPWLMADKYTKEAEKLQRLKMDPYVAFEKEFLRWMLSDGAAALLIQNQPFSGLSLQINWIEITSYANLHESCMYAGAEKLSDGTVKGWSEFAPEEWLDRSLFTLKQDVKLLGSNIVGLGMKYLKEIIAKRSLDLESITWFLPHLSSEFFREKIFEAMNKEGIAIPYDKWFTNLTRLGNVGSASGFFMLEELLNSGKLKKGDRLLLMVPESARFSYAFSLFTVC